MRIRTVTRLAAMLLLALCTALHADRPLLTLEEFKAYAKELAPRVNLFRDVWEKDPNAEFFGGTSRDYLYWLKHRLIKGAKSHDDVEANFKHLMELPKIDVRDFIVGESDIDLITDSAGLPVSHWSGH